MSPRRALIWIIPILAVALLVSLYLLNSAQDGATDSRKALDPESLKERARRSQNLGIPELAVSSSPHALATVRGEVINDLNDQRVPGIVIQVLSQVDASSPVTFLIDTVSDRQGKYSLQVQPGRLHFQWLLVGEESNDSVFRLGSTTLGALTTESPIQLDLHCEVYPRITIQGVVLDDEASQPIPEATVHTLRDLDTLESKWNDPKELAKVEPYFSCETQTKSDGSFKMIGMIVPGRSWVYAIKDGYIPYMGDQEKNGFLVTQETRQHADLVIRMEKEIRATLTGRFLSEAGLPVVRARVTVKNGPFEQDVVTDSTGTFKSLVSPEPVKVTVRHAEYRTLRYELGQINPNQEQGVVFNDESKTLERKSLRVALSVVDENGQPVNNASLLVAEIDKATGGEVNPFFEINVTQGVATFYVDPKLLYGFNLPGSTSGAIGPVNTSGDVSKEYGGRFLEFKEPSTTVTLTLRKK